MEYLALNWKDDYVIFNSQDTEYKAPYGAVPCGEKITFKIKINKKAMPENVRLHILEDNKENPNCPHKVEYSMEKKESVNIAENSKEDNYFEYVLSLIHI